MTTAEERYEETWNNYLVLLFIVSVIVSSMAVFFHFDSPINSLAFLIYSFHCMLMIL